MPLAPNPYQAQYTINDLVGGSNPSGSEVAEFIQSGQSVKLTVQQLFSTPGAGGQLSGTATNDSANSGNVGEYIASNIPVGSAVPLTTGTTANLTNIPLTPGDWDVDLLAYFTGTATTNVSYLACSISTTSATIDQTNGRLGLNFVGGVAAFNYFFAAMTANPTTQRFSLASPTTIYATVVAVFTVSTCSAYGLLRARRVR